MFQVATQQPGIQPDTLFMIWSLPVTNAMLTNLLVLVLFLCLGILISKRTAAIPNTFHTILESLVESFIALLEQVTGKRETAIQLLPLVGTIFLYIGVSNLLLLIPGLGAITYNGVSLFRTPTNDFNTTFSIALGIIVVINIISIKTFGLFGHLGKFFKFKEVYLGFKSSIQEGLIAIVDFLVGLLDIISEMAKVVSLSLRLFGNMYAGEVLAVVLLGAFAALAPAPWLAMNLLVGVLQAMVFGLLVTVYYTLATQVMDKKTA